MLEASSPSHRARCSRSASTVGGAGSPRAVQSEIFGPVSVNTHAPIGSELPHGGFGSSGYGKDLGSYCLDDYTRIKQVAHALWPAPDRRTYVFGMRFGCFTGGVPSVG